MSKKSDCDIFAYLTRKNIRKHLIYNDPARPNEISHLIALPMVQFTKHIDKNLDINRYLWNLRHLKAPCLSKICTRLQLYKDLRAQGQYSIEAMIAAINTQTGNRKFRFYSTVHAVSSEVPHVIKPEVPQVIARGVSQRECVAHINSKVSVPHTGIIARRVSQRESVAHIYSKDSVPQGITRDVSQRERVAHINSKDSVPQVITRGVSRRERVAHIKDPGHAVLPSDNESSVVLVENVIDEKIDLLVNKVGQRIGRLNHYLDTCNKLIDEKEQAMERTIQIYKDSLQKKEQLLQEYEERIQETKQSIRELKNSIYEKRRSWDQFRETMDISLEEGNNMYQCVGEALERARGKLKL